VTFIDLGAPAVTGRILDAQASPSGDVWVDIEVTNGGDGFAGQVTITEGRFSALKGSGPVVLTTPGVVGSLAPGATRVGPVTAVLPPGSKFNVQARGQFKNQQGITRGFVIKPEIFK